MGIFGVELRVPAVGLALTALFVTALLLAPSPAEANLREFYCEGIPFQENEFVTSRFSRPSEDGEPTHLVQCTQGSYALCHYSGAEPLPCTIDQVEGNADCRCKVFEASAEEPLWVDITSILNTCVYIETVARCAVDGSKCTEPDSAPVCDYIARGTLMPHADLVSTFSDRKVKGYKAGCTDCEGVYASCMTAPCWEEEGGDGSAVRCECPLARGEYRFGRSGDDLTCDAGDGLAWSASYDPEGCVTPTRPEVGGF